MGSRVFMKEQLVKEVTPIGNGAHIFAPKEWVGEEVLIVRTLKPPIKERILKVLEPHLENILGVYLYGSRARGEQRRDSDIDLLVISNKRFKLKEEGFEIIVTKKEELKEDIRIAPVLIYSALNEAKPVINSELLSELRKGHSPKASDFREFVKETESIIKINEEIPSAYSIILRLRSIYIIERILSGRNYSHKEFRGWVFKDIKGKADFDKVYEAYLRVKKGYDEGEIDDHVLEKILSVLKIKTRRLKEKLWPKEKRGLKNQ